MPGPIQGRPLYIWWHAVHRFLANFKLLGATRTGPAWTLGDEPTRSWPAGRE